MDLYIDRDELSRGLARVQGVIERRSTQPLLSHVLLHARESSLRMSATDTEVAHIGDLTANVEAPGEIAVDAASFFQIVRALPEHTVHLSTTANHRLEIHSGRAHFKLPGYAAEDYPALPTFDARGSAKLSEGALRRLVEITAFSVATDDVRYGLNGVHLEASSQSAHRLRMVATDGHRLSAGEADFEGELLITPQTLIPRKALAVIRKLLDHDDATVELSFGEGAIRITRPDQIFWFRLIEGGFPEYSAVVPTENKHRATISCAALASTLKRIGILIQDRSRAVRFDFQEEELRIDVHNADRGEVSESVPIDLEGGVIQVGFNARYLQDILNVIKGDKVILELAHPLAPCLVRDPEDDSAFFVVMPMRLD